MADAEKQNKVGIKYSIPAFNIITTGKFNGNDSCLTLKNSVAGLFENDINNIKVSINGVEIDESLPIAEMKQIADYHERENHISFVVEDRRKGCTTSINLILHFELSFVMLFMFQRLKIVSFIVFYFQWPRLLEEVALEQGIFKDILEMTSAMLNIWSRSLQNTSTPA